MESTKFLIKISFILASAAVLLGLIVLFGWFFRIPILIQIFPDLAPMQFNTALLMVLSGVGIGFAPYKGEIYARFLGAFIFAFAGVTLAQTVFDVNLYLDELFHAAYITVKSSNPGRMAPNTAVCYMSIGFSLFLCNPKKGGESNRYSILLSIIALAFGAVSVFGYLANFQSAYGWGDLTDMALHTSIGMVLLGSALFLANVTCDRTGNFSPWLVNPLLFLVLLVIAIMWRSIEVERISRLYNQENFEHRYLIYYVLISLIIIAFFLQKASIRFANALEEAQLASSVNIKVKSTILNYVSHELRNPLNAVIGFSEPFLEDTSLSSELQEALDCIYTASMHMKGIVDDLLAVSRFSSGKMRIDSHEYHFEPWITSLCKILAKRGENQNIIFSYSYPEDMPAILRGDSLKLGQIIINLTENAFKYTPQSGEVKLRLWLDDSSIKPYLHIKVEDTGRGIPADVQHAIFRPFFQTYESDVNIGLGLGLSICKQYLDMMGGSIDVQSQENQGTVFHCKAEAYLDATF